MKAIVVNQTGNAQQLQYSEQPIPQILDHEVLVKNEFIGINYIDIYFRSGIYPKELPFILGQEGSGTIASVGKAVKNFKVGDRVAYTSNRSGSYAEFTAVNSAELVHLPKEISFEIAAACLLQGLTAHYLTHSTFVLNHNHTILMHAGAGGVGTWVIQMAKHLGAKIITTVSTSEKAQLATSLGADHIILYTHEPLVERLKQLTHGQGVDVVYDAVGKSTFNDSMQCLKLRGTLVSFGQASGNIPPLDVKQLSSHGSLYLTRPVLYHYIATPEALAQRANELFQYISQHHFKTIIHKIYPLADAAIAHTDLESRKTTGKLLLKI